MSVLNVRIVTTAGSDSWGRRNRVQSGTDEVFSRFRKFYQEYPSRRMDCHENAVVITLLIPGPDPIKLAETLYRFCPDMEDFRFVVES